MAGPCDNPAYAVTHPGECTVGQVVNQVAQTGFDRLLSELASAMVRTSNMVMTFWMKVPPANPLTTPYTTGGQPTPVPAAPQLTDAIATARGSLLALAAVVGFLGIVTAVVRAVRHNRAGEMMSIPEMLFRLITVSMFGVVAVWVGIQGSDLYANWILERAQPGFGSRPSPGLIKETWIINAGLINGGLLVLVGVLSSLAQIAFMFFRGALLLLLLVIWPTVAAGTATEAGLSAFKKVNAWIIALLLYKPIAATVYAVGFLVYARTDVDQGFGGEVMSLLLGTTILVLAALALPMLVRFVMPPAGIGASSAFSGGAVIAGVATGAVAVAGVAAGGGAAAASGAGPAAVGSGGQWASGGDAAGSPRSASGGAEPPAGGGGAGNGSTGGVGPSGGSGPRGEGGPSGGGGPSDRGGSGGERPTNDGGTSETPPHGGGSAGSIGAGNASAGSSGFSGGGGVGHSSDAVGAGAGAPGSGGQHSSSTSAAQSGSAASGSGRPPSDGGGGGSFGSGSGAWQSRARDWRPVADAVRSQSEHDDMWEGQ